MANWINGKTRLCGIFGDPVAHSFSPAMHNAAFAALGLNWVYLPFAVAPAHLASAVAGIRALGLAGVNVTIPHKQGILPYLDELSAEARLIGAVNTVINRDGSLYGENTDATGFLVALGEETGFRPAGKTALIIGAGGAARAVAAKLALAGVGELYITNRTRERAEDLAALLENHTKAKIQVLTWPTESGEALKLKPDLTVQTTSAEMIAKGKATDWLPSAVWGPGQVVCDLVYNPAETPLMRSAGGAGATVLGGLGMLLHQGALAFQLWTGRAAPLDIMKQALLRAIGQEAG